MKNIHLIIALILTAAISIAGDYPLVWVNNAQTGKQDRTLNGKTIYADVSSVRGHLSSYSANRAAEPKNGPLSNYTYVRRPGFSGYSARVVAKMTRLSTAQRAHELSIVPAGGHPAAGNNKYFQINVGGAFSGASFLNGTGGMVRIGDSTKTPTSKLTVISDLASSAVNYVARLVNNVTTQFAQAVLSFDFNSGTVASINAIQNSSGRNSALTFNNMTGAALREAMRITGNAALFGISTNPLGARIINYSDTAGALYGQIKSHQSNAGFFSDLYSDNANNTSSFNFRRFGGTLASPTKTPKNAAIASMTGTVSNGNGPVAIKFAAYSTASSNSSAYMAFLTQNNNDANAFERMRITQEGRVGIGTSTPAQPLQVGNGFKVYSASRVELASSTMPMPTEEGLIWKNQHTFYGNQYKVTRSFNMAHGIVTSDTTVGNTTTETTVYTAAQAANYPTVGKTIRIKLLGYLSKTAAATLTIRLKVGSTTLLTSTVASTGSPLTNIPLHGDWYFTYRTVGASGTCISSAAVDVNNISIDSSATATTTVDTTAANNITVTFQWSAADASNTTTVTQGYTETLGALEWKDAWFALHFDPIARREDVA